MTRIRHYHLIFGLSLVALAALGTWWTIFMGRSVALERRAGLAELNHNALETALSLGHVERAPIAADLPEGIALELVACGQENAGVPLEPLHAEACVRPAPAAVRALDEKLQRRRAMVAGEGGFLFLLLGVCTVMLFVLVRQERRQMRRMESFIHAVTHQMKTPLAGIKSLLETLLAGKVPEAVTPRLLGLGLEQAERLEHAIENVLLAGAMRSGHHQVQVQAVPLRAQLDRFVEHRRRTWPGHADALSFVWALERTDATVEVDPDMLRVVLENLVDNALKYGVPSGGGPARVVLRVLEQATCLSIAVSDEGIGFDPRHAADLFAPFHRGHNPGGEVLHGTGLGLSIARDLCRRMGGDLLGSSKGVGQGATFTVILPGKTVTEVTP